MTKDGHARNGASIPSHGQRSQQPGNRSPTPGPSSPMRGRGAGYDYSHSNNPLGELNNLTDEDLLDGSNDSAGVENDSKPIDLNLFKNKLYKKLDARNATSAGNLFRASRGSAKK